MIELVTTFLSWLASVGLMALFLFGFIGAKFPPRTRTPHNGGRRQ